MSNLPFGFSTSGDDSSAGPGDPAGPAPGPFDLGQLGAMLSQLGAMMSEAGTTTSTGPVNYDLARKMATSQVPASHPVAAVDANAVRDAIALAEIWLDGTMAFPVGATATEAWTAREWIDKTMASWKELCNPIAERVSQAWVESLPDTARQQLGPLLAMMGSMGGMAFGSQLGQGLAGLATEVLTSTDIGLPLGPRGVAALMPRSIAELSASLEISEEEIRLYLAAREAAHHRLYGHVPWLRPRVVELITRYAAAISVDFSAMEELAGLIDPSNPASIEAALGKGMFEPTITPEQRRTLVTLETLLALIEGWVDTVVQTAVGERMPSASALHETMRRRRATGGPAEQAFATLIGLELRPKQLRAASELWEGLGQSRGIEGRDAIWADPDLLPTGADLDDPQSFLRRDREFADLLAGAGEWSLDDVDVDLDADADADADGDAPETAAEGPADTAPDGSRADDHASDHTGSATGADDPDGAA